MRIVAVTACPTGIAHTYLAAEALTVAAGLAGHQLTVETQGASGIRFVDPAVLERADVVVVAADVEIADRDRFHGRPLVQVSLRRAIGEAAAVLAEAVESVGRAAPAPPPPARLRASVMTGVGYVIPFVAAGGLLLALAFVLGGYGIAEVDQRALVADFSPLSRSSWAAALFVTGTAAYTLLVPVLGGYVAYAIAGRPGLAPGFVGGALAGGLQAGFLGGLGAGLLAGVVALWFSRIAVPTAVRPLLPVVIVPLVATLVTGLVVLVVVGPPLAAFSLGLTGRLDSLAGANAILLGVLLGAMMGFDLGGPVNKTAYAFATAGLTLAPSARTGTPLLVMAAVMAAGMTPPLGLALATVLRPRLFTAAERDSGRSAWVLGASFITEGALPFAALDPLRVIPAVLGGSAFTGGLVMTFGSTLRAPHGGFWVLPLIGRPLLFLLAVVLGTLVTAALVVLLKPLRRMGASPA